MRKKIADLIELLTGYGAKITQVCVVFVDIDSFTSMFGKLAEEFIHDRKQWFLFLRRIISMLFLSSFRLTWPKKNVRFWPVEMRFQVFYF